jgi:hypothetical protein
MRKLFSTIFGMAVLSTLSAEEKGASAMSKQIKVRAAIVVCLLLPQNATADHFPAPKVARSKPERVLAGVNVYSDKISLVIQRLGKPTNYSDAPLADGPEGSGERNYEWLQEGVKVRVGTEYYTDKESKKIIESAPMIVDVWGSKTDPKFGCTGAGLSLGDNIAKAQRLYGSRYQKDQFSITLQWKDETTLVIDFNDTGTIKHMQLLAAVE